MKSLVSQIKSIAVSENLKCLCCNRLMCSDSGLKWIGGQFLRDLCAVHLHCTGVCILAVYYYQHINVPWDNPQKRIFVFNVNTTFSRHVTL